MMQKNLTFSASRENRLTRGNRQLSVFFGYLLALPLSLVIGAFREVLLLGATTLLFRIFLGAPRFSFALWGGEILSLGGAAALLAREGGELFATFTPFYWGVFLFLSLSMALLARRFFLPMFLLTGVMALALWGTSPWIIFSLWGGAAGGIYPLPEREEKFITFM